MRLLLLVVALAFAGPAFAAELLCVSAEKANIRRGPSTASAAAWLAPRYTAFRVVRRKGAWIKVQDVDGFTGWAHRSVLRDDPCVVVKGERANVRRGPGLDEEVLWEVEHGYAFYVLAGLGDWLQVTDSEYVEGWIFTGLVWGKTEPGRRGEI
jgi:SH3-like domain-containing protein